MKAALKYCGNCNPEIDGPALVSDLQARMPELEILPPETPDRDVLIIVSGCPRDCATRPDLPGLVVVVAGANLDCVHHDQAEMVEALLIKLGKISGGHAFDPD